MPRKRRASPPARPVYGNLLTQAQLDRFLSHLREKNLSQDACGLAELQRFVEALQARLGFATVRSALAAAGVSLCEFCDREGKASVATENIELDTGMRSVGAFALACNACRPKALGTGPAA